MITLDISFATQLKIALCSWEDYSDHMFSTFKIIAMCGHSNESNGVVLSRDPLGVSLCKIRYLALSRLKYIFFYFIKKNTFKKRRSK